MIKSKWQFILRHTCIDEFTFKQFGYQKNKTKVGECFFIEFGYQKKKQILLIIKKHSAFFLSV